MNPIVCLRNYIRVVVISIRHFYFTSCYRMNIARTARISWNTTLDKTHPSGIHIDEESYLASGAIVLSHDFSRSKYSDTYIGKRCFIGVNAIIMCGVRIGDEVIIGANSVVTKDIPSNSIAVGNPARIIKEGINTERYGKLKTNN